MTIGDGTRLLYLLLKQARPGFEAVQFVAAYAGEGTSSVVRDLGLIASGLDVRVLLLDLGSEGQEHASWLRQNCSVADGSDVLRRWPPNEPGQDIVSAPGLQDIDILQVSGSSLHVSWRPADASVTPAHYLQMLAGLRGQFDLILIDTAAFQRSATALLLAPHAFASVLVVAAERTRIRAVDDLRTQLLDCGGVVAGMVLNRYRRYIPKFIYDRL